MGPFLLASEIEFPELPEEELEPGQIPVRVLLGGVPSHLDGAAARGDFPDFEASTREFLLRVASTGRYYVRDGEEIRVEPAPPAPAADVRTYVLASAFAALCHQRGYLPLHASSVQGPTGVVAFVGRSGAGKSSLAAHLSRRGYPVISDDICLLDPTAPWERRVLPVAPWLKLWGDTLDVLRQPTSELPRAVSAEDKYRLRLEGGPRAALPLAEVIVLERGDPGSAVEFTALTPARVMQTMLEQTFQAYVVRATGQTAAYFQRGGRALQGVRVFAMRRPWGFAAMDTVLDALEHRLRGIP